MNPANVAAPPAAARREPGFRPAPADEAWRAARVRQIVDFSARLHEIMPVEPERLRVVLTEEGAHDRALRGAMAALNLNFDRVLLVIGAFVDGNASLRPAPLRLGAEISTLVELGVLQVARSDSSPDGRSGLTPRGQQVAAYLLYRLLVAATPEGGS